MSKQEFITASIVLYKENEDVLKKTIDSFIETPLSKKLYLIDNSSSKVLKHLSKHSDIEYIFTGENIGFSSAHNLIIEKVKNFSSFHLILNPDISFNTQTIPFLIQKLKKDPLVAMIAPKVLYPSGKVQYTCRKFPTLFELIVRRSGPFKPFFSSIIAEGEYRNRDISVPFYCDFVIGCFQLFKTEEFVRIEGFDQQYFLYMEDVDICKKIAANNKKVLYEPNVEISHRYNKGSSKNLKLFYTHIVSIFKYFYKWKLKRKK